ncbi:MAG: hypothetical protein GF317_08645 [Candidatus Lokiarchaeota archaeon]|nr:hypothetical protein [Candidatus Lokiarchaeota archaeon]MBD3199783.1 hypothetical protein [Candidatus Lokiarchaeota archaeon]
MSIHGSQYILPLFSKKDTKQPFLNDDDELVLAFHLLTKDVDPGHKILTFSRVLWPFLSIQGIISTHIILDGLKIYSKKGKFTNPPRQPLIGHVLRNVEERTHIEQLEKIIKVLTYKDEEAEEISTGEDSEYQIVQIEALTNPEFLDGLLKLIPYLGYNPIEGYMPLDTNLTTDNALDIAEEYRNIIETLKGNSMRWKGQIGLIGDEIEKWLVDLNVQMKDINSRYDSQIKKTAMIIDDEEIKSNLEVERDKLENWLVNEKKKLLDNVAVQFKTIDRHLEDILKRNKFYSNEDTLKRKSFENQIENIETHLEDLKEEGNKFLKTIESVQEKFNLTKEKANDYDNRAKRRLEDFEKDLRERLSDRNKQVSKYSIEKQERIEILKQKISKIESLFNQIKEIIRTKAQDCINESEDLKSWSIEDTEADLFAKPIQWIYMPAYIMFIEDEDMFEEYMRIVLPGYISNNQSSLYEEVSEGFSVLKNHINEKIEDDMVLRSNFEFSSENKNILKDPNLNKRMQKGFSKLRGLNIINEDTEKSIREILKNLT